MVTLVGVGCTILGLLVGIISFGRNRDKDIRADATRTAIIETKLDSISVGVNAIQLDNKESNLKMDDFSTRLTQVEESTKSAHKRIDDRMNSRQEVSQ